MYGEKYIWLLAASATGGWIFKAENFDKQHPNIDCELKHIITAAEGLIVISKIDIRQDNRTTISGLVSNDTYAKSEVLVGCLPVLYPFFSYRECRKIELGKVV